MKKMLGTLFAIALFPRAILAEPFAFVTNFGSDDVSVIDTATGTVLTTIAVGTSPTGVAIRADGTRAFISNTGSNSVSVIDGEALAVIDTVAVGSAPIGMTLSPDESRLYVANNGSDSLTVLDAEVGVVIATVDVPGAPIDVAALPDGSRIYVAGELGPLTTLDAASLLIIESTQSTQPKNSIVASPDGSKIVFSSPTAGSISFLNADGSPPVITLGIGGNPRNLAYSRDGSRLFVTGANDDLIMYRTEPLMRLADTETGPFPVGVAVGSGGHAVYVTDLQDDRVTVLRTDDLSVLRQIPVGSSPQTYGAFVAAGPEGAPPAVIPTLGPWGLLLFAALIAVAFGWTRRRGMS